MNGHFGSTFAVAAICAVIFACSARADPYAIIESSAPSISRGASIDSGQTITLAADETVSFSFRDGGVLVQRTCVGPYSGEIRYCTNNPPRRPVGISGGARSDD